ARAVTDVLRDETAHQVGDYFVRHDPVFIRKLDRKCGNIAAVGSRDDGIDLHGLAHQIDHIFHGQSLALAFIKIEIIDDGGEYVAVEDGGGHRGDAVGHILGDGGLDHVLRHPLRHDTDHRHRFVAVRPNVNSHHAGHQRQQKRPENPALMPAQDVDVILDVQRTPGYVEILGWLHSSKSSG